MSDSSLKVSRAKRQLNDQKVLVTGGLGYIGSHVVVSLLLTGKYLPIIIDNCHNAYPEAVKRCAEIARDEMGYVSAWS
jgi:UDP-glucose 4-epimerase